MPPRYILREAFERRDDNHLGLAFGQLWSYRRGEQLKWQRLRPFEQFAGLIERQRDGIAAYCTPRDKVKLDFVDELNNKIRMMRRRAYGYRDAEYMRLKLFTAFLPKK